MATYKYTVYTYRCPRCRLDLGRRFGLMTTPCIRCSRCGTNVQVSTAAILQNWAYNFGWVGGVLLWIVLAVGIVLSPEFANTVSDQMFRGAEVRNPVVLLAGCLIPAFLAGLLSAFVGMVLGALASLLMTTAPTARSEVPAPTGLLLPRTSVNSPAPTVTPTSPWQRNLLVRLVFIFLWPLVFFFTGAMVLGMLAPGEANPSAPRALDGAGTAAVPTPPAPPALHRDSSAVAEPQPPPDQARTEFHQQTAPWLLGGTLVVFIAGCAGWLPSTSRHRKPLLESHPLPQLELGLRGLESRAAPDISLSYSQERSYLVRGVFVVLWPIVFCVAAAVVRMALDGSFTAATEEAQKQINEQSAHANAPWIALGTVLVFVLGCVGILPGTSRKRATRS